MKPAILIVDDQEDIRVLVRLTLGTDDFTIKEAGTGEEALEIVRTERPDLVLLDVTMPPGLDGFEVCRRIRKDPATMATKVIMLTAAGRDQDRRLATQAGASGYFVKPFSPHALLTRIYGEFEH